MICMSPLLEMMELLEVWIPGGDFDEWVIRAPNLRDLHIESYGDCWWQIGWELPSLQEAYVKIEDYSVDRDLVSLLTHFTQVRELEFLVPLTEVNALQGLSCCFQKLKSLTLVTDFCNASSILSTFSLLRSAPNLEKLEIEIMDDETQNEVDMDFFNALWINGLFANLKRVSMKNVPFYSNEMRFIEFVLSKASLLHAIYVYHDDSKPIEEVAIELGKLSRASSKAKVFLRSMEGQQFFQL
ncbi:hypothetical protein ACP70R_000684 [Stipagrostis hirtigluma subsp. patula]